jgi:hypothetical protein
LPHEDCPDPIGALQEGLAFGYQPKNSDFGTYVQESSLPASCWAQLRNGTSLLLDCADNDVFVRLAGSTNKDLWRLVAGELSTFRHPRSGDTLLHVAARTGNAEVVSLLESFWINPLLRNSWGQLAADVAATVALKNELRLYAMWKPQRVFTRWYGPWFELRAITFW